MMNNFEDTNITYAYLVSSDTEFISNKISKEYAFGIFAKAIERGEITAGDALNLWMNKLKKVYKYEDFCRSDWGFLTICCQNYFEKMTLDDTSTTDNKEYKKLSCWLKESAEFLKSIHLCDDKIHFTGLCLFLNYILKSAQKSCRFLAAHENKSDLLSQIGWINSLHDLSHKLIWDSLGNIEHTNISGAEYRALFHYINGLCSSVAIDTFIVIKTKVEAWKFVAKCILKYGTYVKKYNKRLEENFNCPKLPVRILLREVESSLVMIYKKERREDAEYVEQHSRVIAFYLEILYRITTVFKHSEFPEVKMFLDVLVLSLAPKISRKSHVFTCIEKRVLPALTNELSLVYKHKEFQKLISNHIGGRDYCYEFVVAYLRCCITNHNDEFFASSIEMFIEIFKRCFQSLDVFMDADRFDEIIDVYAVLTLLDSSGAVLRNMQQYVMKGDLALSFACTELLILVSSCNKSRVADLNDGLQFWLETNNRFAQFSSNYRRLNVERLIGHFIILCSGARLEQNTDNQLQQAIYSQNNYKPHRYINAGSNISEATMAMGKLSGLIDILERTEMSLKDYYNCVAQMYEFVKYKAEVSDCLQRKIAELLTKVCKPCLINAKPHFKRFMSAGLLLMANNNINAETQLKILSSIKDYIHSGTYFPMLSFWLIIQSCRKQKVNLIVRNIAEAIYKQLEIPDIIQVIIFETAWEASHNSAPDFIHIANSDNNGESAMSIRFILHRKRSRKDIDHDECEIEDTIQNINSLLRKIAMFSKQLKRNDFVKLNKICNDIKEITDRHNSVE